MENIQKTFEDDMMQHGEMGYIVKLPEEGWHRKDIIKKVDDYLELGHYKWDEGFVSGAVYNFDSKINELVTKVYGKTAYTNPLHPDVFPGGCWLNPTRKLKLIFLSFQVYARWRQRSSEWSRTFSTATQTRAAHSQAAAPNQFCWHARRIATTAAK
jgi:hypothetical protein